MVKFTENSMKTLEKRYLLKDKYGKTIETPDQLFDRVVNTVCCNKEDNKQLKETILEMMHDLRFLPNTPTLMNAGTTNMLSACFVINIDDTLESIVHDAGWQQAYIHKLGGGVGMNFSKLRPKGDLIKTTGGITTGVMGFLPIFNELSESIRQGGKRNGANMGILSIHHPEIEEWITAKIDNNRFRNFNLSVLVDNKFMETLEHDDDWNLSFNGKIHKTVKAKYLFDLICDSAHKCGCPGVIFKDTINENNPLKEFMSIECTNPCGEIPAFAGYFDGELIAESCNLGSLNLSKYVNYSYCYNEEIIKKDKYFDFDKFKEDIHNATEFLDLVIDANNYPFDFIDKGTKLTRKIGLGVTGLSECLIKLRMEYGSEKSIKFIENIFEILQTESHKKSEELGKLKGNFPLNYLMPENYQNRRNLCTTGIAPTGTIGRFMLGHPYSSGIEPPPAICMSSNIIDSKIEDGIYPLLITMLKESTQKGDELYIENIVKQIKKDGKSIQHLTQIPEDIRKLFRVAEEISIEDHIKIQSTIQKYIDNAVSKTINMRNDATIDDVKKAYLLAYKSKCKGVTIYRDNCKDHQVFESSKIETTSQDNTEPIEDLSPRPPILGALSFTKKTSCNTLFINPTYLGNTDKSALESFISANGGCTAMRNGLAIAISVYQRLLETINPTIARKGLDIVMTHLQQIHCQACTKQIESEKHKNVKHPVDSISCPAAMADAMKFMLNHKVETYIDRELLKHESLPLTDNLTSKRKCPECGNTNFIKQEGCMNELCPCGWGGCS